MKLKNLRFSLATAIVTAFVMQVATVTAQFHQFALSATDPIREIGTNLFDFSLPISHFAAGKSLPMNSPIPTYLVVGKIVQMPLDEANAVYLQISRGVRYRRVRGAIINNGTSGILMQLAADSLSRNGDISVGQYLSFSPAVAALFEPVEPTYRIQLKNCPMGLRRLDATISVLACPSGNHTYRMVNGDLNTIQGISRNPNYSHL